MIAVEKFRPLFAAQGREIPAVKVTNGWPASGGMGIKKQRIGECWDASETEDGKAQIFISPVLDKPANVLAVLLHELVHAVVGCKARHGSAFKTLAFGLGLVPPATSTTVSPELHEKLKAIAEEIGRYPHSKIQLKEKPKLASVLIKSTCPQCGYNCRLLRKWASAYGAPLCPAHKEPMDIEWPIDPAKPVDPIEAARKKLEDENV